MDESQEPIGKRDKRLFRLFVGAICSLPFVFGLITVLLHGDSRLQDTLAAVYLWVGLLLFLGLLAFSIRVWRRNRRLAWMGFGFIAFVILLGVLSAWLPDFL